MFSIRGEDGKDLGLTASKLEKTMGQFDEMQTVVGYVAEGSAYNEFIDALRIIERSEYPALIEKVKTAMRDEIAVVDRMK